MKQANVIHGNVIHEYYHVDGMHMCHLLIDQIQTSCFFSKYFSECNFH